MTLTDIVQLGEPVEHRGIVVAPVFPRRDPVAAYVTLDQALAGGLTVREVDEAGSVPELVVENPLDARALLYDGEELVGAKQNRILNVSVLAEAKSSLRIPVSCVEQGRWARRTDRFGAARHISNARLRQLKAEAQAAQPLARGISQTEVWDEVRAKASRMEVHSPTGASSDLYRAYERDLRALEDAFPAQPGQCGGMLGLGADVCLDLVSRPDAFARLWPKLRAGYLLDALERLDGKATPRGELDALASAVEQAEWTRGPSAGLGVDVRVRGSGVIGAGLELDGELIQLSAFTSEDGGRRASAGSPDRARAGRPPQTSAGFSGRDAAGARARSRETTLRRNSCARGLSYSSLSRLSWLRSERRRSCSRATATGRRTSQSTR